MPTRISTRLSSRRAPARSSPAASDCRSPEPAPLLPTQAPLAGPVVLGGEGRLVEPLREILAAADGYDLISNNTGGRGADKLGAAVFDATGITAPAQLSALFEFFTPLMRSTGNSARFVVLGTHPELCRKPDEQIAQRASKASPARWPRRPGRCHRTARLRAPQGLDRPERRRVDAGFLLSASRPTSTPR